MKKEKGITLVALVIMIIVLLILAGITITLTLGDKGIINMAKEAGKNYQDAQAYEQNLLSNIVNEANNIVNSDGISNTTNIGKVRILERGTLDTGSVSPQATKDLMFNFENTYTEADKAYLYVYKREALSGESGAFFFITYGSMQIIGNSFSIHMKNEAGSVRGPGAARYHYWVISGLE